MESEVCQYSKYGFCKFKEACKRKHYNENCRDLSDCQQIKKTAQVDTLKLAKDMLLEAADFKINVPTVIEMITN